MSDRIDVMLSSIDKSLKLISLALSPKSPTSALSAREPTLLESSNNTAYHLREIAHALESLNSTLKSFESLTYTLHNLAEMTASSICSMSAASQCNKLRVVTSFDEVNQLLAEGWKLLYVETLNNPFVTQYHLGTYTSQLPGAQDEPT